MSRSSSSKMPAFNRISMSEGTAIMNMFRMYNLNSTNIISSHYAKKLLKALGFDDSNVELSSTVTSEEFLLLIDSLVPPNNPPLTSSLYTFDRLLAKTDQLDGIKKIGPDEISEFMIDMGRGSMLEHGDCSLVPNVPVDQFDKAVIDFAKKKQIRKSKNFENHEDAPKFS